MSNINFRPWIGKNYFTKGYQGQKILVLGESHHCDGNLCEDGRCYPTCQKEKMQDDCFIFTEGVVRQFVYKYSGEPDLQTLLCFERAVAGKELSSKERETFWQSVMFYNYIQYAQSKARKEPLREQWEQSQEAFVELLNEYTPDKIIVWGVRLFDKLSYHGETVYEMKMTNDETVVVRLISVNGKGIPAMKMNHPSTPNGKKWNYWHQVIKTFLE